MRARSSYIVQLLDANGLVQPSRQAKDGYVKLLNSEAGTLIVGHRSWESIAWMAENAGAGGVWL